MKNLIILQTETLLNNTLEYFENKYGVDGELAFRGEIDNTDVCEYSFHYNNFLIIFYCDYKKVSYELYIDYCSSNFSSDTTRSFNSLDEVKRQINILIDTCEENML